MSKYDNLIDALDEFRQVRDEKRCGVGYDPQGYMEERIRERLAAAEEKLDAVFTSIVEELK